MKSLAVACSGVQGHGTPTAENGAAMSSRKNQYQGVVEVDEAQDEENVYFRLPA